MRVAQWHKTEFSFYTPRHLPRLSVILLTIAFVIPTLELLMVDKNNSTIFGIFYRENVFVIVTHPFAKSLTNSFMSEYLINLLVHEHDVSLVVSKLNCDFTLNFLLDQ